MPKTIKVKNLSIGQGRPKICALVMGETKEDILELAEKSNSVNCDMIEFRADYFPNITDWDTAQDLLSDLRKTVKKPIIFTFRSKEEGGKQEITAEKYKELLRFVAEGGFAELVDIEESSDCDSDFIEELKSDGVYIILSKHDFDRTPSQEEIVKTFINMQNKGADIIKAAYMPNTKRDVLNLINATEEMTSNYAGCPVVAISMGHLGVVTRILGEFLESAITFASITKASAPGQINIEGMEKVLDIIHDNYKKVFLIGFMGTGKTTVANALANNYGLKKIDLDAYIESKEHMSIADMFASQSESYFRDKETKYLRNVLKMNYQVISLGGGIILRNENIEMIKEKGVIVLLTASPETIAKRLENDITRPLLGENMDLDCIKDLMKSRNEMYHEVADMIIDTDNKTVDAICKEIVETLGFNS